MKHIKRVFVFIALSGFTLNLYADDKTPSIEDFAFLTGYWKGTGFGGESEEMWMPPVAGKMFGIFKQSSDSELIFTEFMEITEVDGEFKLRLKHFNPDFSGWEEKQDHVIFPWVSVSPNKAVFGALSYELVEPDKLKIELRLRESDGTRSTEVVNFTRERL